MEEGADTRAVHTHTIVEMGRMRVTRWTSHCGVTLVESVVLEWRGALGSLVVDVGGCLVVSCR
uniref:Uncharacterized protein n=1 Tax=Setaria digitata TaxID=48799 RepID=A0A915PFK7_9BILA